MIKFSFEVLFSYIFLNLTSLKSDLYLRYRIEA